MMDEDRSDGSGSGPDPRVGGMVGTAGVGGGHQERCSGALADIIEPWRVGPWAKSFLGPPWSPIFQVLHIST